jgi:hypothetical protein
MGEGVGRPMGGWVGRPMDGWAGRKVHIKENVPPSRRKRALRRLVFRKRPANQ